ncbi:MAG TPA: hypothetical protein VGG19_19835 [Tepidisphaeraceae bacterium]|jgi:hypothetical protein
MTEKEWLSSSNPQALMWFLRNEHKPIEERRWRVFALWCVQRPWTEFTDPRSRLAMESFAGWIDGLVSDAELANAHELAKAAEHEAWVTKRRKYPELLARAISDGSRDASSLASGIASHACSAAGYVAWQGAQGTREVQKQAKHAAWHIEANEQCKLFREIMGNPFAASV